MELPAIGAAVAALRGIEVETLARATTENAFDAMPRLRGLAAAGFGDTPAP